MQQFVVPQFIDAENKVFGPITTRQFFILLIAGGIIYLSWRYTDLVLFAVITLVVGGSALLFGWYKPNGQLFHFFLLNIFQSLRRPSLRIWNNALTKQELDEFRKRGTDIAVEEKQTKKPVRRARIQELSLLVNTGGYYHPDAAVFADADREE